jgi:hypothetical protein
MFDHLIEFEPEVEDVSSAKRTRVHKADPSDRVDAQVKTADWLKELGAAGEEVVTEIEAKAARDAFTNLVSAQAPEITHSALAQVKTPAAVQHLVGLLTAYDWEFVHQAKELRGYTVAKLIEETNHPTASIRLKALALLGKVTEVGLFTEKIEVKKNDMTDAELESRIKEKLGKLAKIVEVTDVIEVNARAQALDEDEDGSSTES